MRNLFCFCLLSALLWLTACTPKTTSALKGNNTIDKFSGTLATPQKVNASDGVYPSHILVYWDAVPEAQGYRVFRTEKDKPNTKKEITKNQQQSSWLSDYTAKPTTKYQYNVQATAAGTLSAASTSDIGYLKTTQSIAHIESSDDMVLASPNAPKFTITLDQTTYSKGSSMTINYELPKAVPYTSQLRFYLSDDADFDWKDTFISDMEPRSFTPDAVLQGSIRVQLPSAFTGKTHFLAVYSTDGKVVTSGVIGKEIVVE